MILTARKFPTKDAEEEAVGVRGGESVRTAVTVADKEFEVPEELTLYGKWHRRKCAEPILANDGK
jgi:hypothetical protein